MTASTAPDSTLAANAPGAGTMAAGADAVRIAPVPAFRDNYIWLLTRGTRAVVVDPGDAAPVLAQLAARHLQLEAILVTHHHADHVGGVAELVQAQGARVYGPAASPYPGITVPVREGDRVCVLDTEFLVLEVPGHTLDHIAYWSAALGALFCGDTLFAGGCGRLFEGTAAQMALSLGKLAALPGATRVYCAHEYTQSNLRFALAVEPDNAALSQRRDECTALRARGTPTVPSTIAQELATNPFLRCTEPTVVAAAVAGGATAPPAAARKAGASDPVAVFAALRSWKDRY